MRLSTSRVLALVSNSGLSTDGWPTSASTAVPPRAGLGTVATGWHPASARTAANAATTRLPREMRRHPDVGYRADEERDDQDPRGPVNLALEAAPGAVPAAEPGVAAADRPAEARRLGCLNQHAGHEEDRELALPVGDQPRPAAAELADRGLLQLLFELVVAAECVLQRVRDAAARVAPAARAHDGPEDRVVGVAAGVVADHRADVLRHVV